ncbi:MAG TPA: diacylglycerol kinase family protein [Microbacterium sp.]|uniref:diacylglycerol/lipid kinase family protein n=1 Tax=Microbacterium sp. TaxID=51671 RepID=UPI002CCA7EF6|nr:diacylglycerol kinase family protein [Microbacterium sp.]HWI31112.1 diacylglycerol kinase family protein [Microbacterium sp.]
MTAPADSPAPGVGRLHPARPTRRRAALVYNPIKVNAKELRTLVKKHSAAAGWGEPAFFETTVEDLGADVARKALAEGADAVLVAGGDGTVRAVSEAMNGSGVPMTIVPSGTGNLLARNLNLPLDSAAKMVRATFDGDVHPVDIGIVRITRANGSAEERAFVVMSGVGLDAAMIANTSAQLKKTVGWVAYVDGAARSLPFAKPFRAMYQLDGHRLHSTKAQSVLFANCGSLPAGISLVPDASIMDGKLDVCIIKPAGMFGWARVWRRIWWENSVMRRSRAGQRALARRPEDASVRYLRGVTVEVATNPPQALQLDGDEFGEATRVRCRIVEGGLLTVVPKGHTMHGI